MFPICKLLPTTNEGREGETHDEQTTIIVDVLL